jgi:prophage antirepressor-like protein
MAALIPLLFEAADIRMIVRDGVPWWVLNDVCAILEIANPRHAATRLRDWQKGVAISDTLGGPQEVAVVNEAGIYKLVLGSRKSIAEEFERWLTCEVIPSIRQHGSYPPPVRTAPVLSPIDDQTPWDGVDKTIGQRFKEERERWEAETGYKLAGTIPGISKFVARAIEDDMGGIRKGNRMEMLLYAGIDVLYVMTGRRTLTAAERAVRDAYRGSDPLSRADLLISAITLPRVEQLD